MSTFKVAHIREQGVDLIIIPLDDSFANKTFEEQNEAQGALQLCASSAGLAGTVVPVWRKGRGMAFLAPRNFHPYFESISMSHVAANLNRELTCSGC